MNQEFTLAELVKKYGTNAQKTSLKNKGNLSGKEFILLKKSVLLEWEECKVKGLGSKRIITCTGKRPYKLERIDNRSNNGKGQLVGEFELNSLVLNYLIQNDNKVSPMSTTKWLTELGVADIKLTGVYYSGLHMHLEKIQVLFSEVLEDYNKTDEDFDMLDEFLNVSFKSMKSNLVSVFNKLDKAKLIIHQKERWGCTTNNNHRKLKRAEIKEIANIKRTLLTKFGLKVNELYKTKKKEVKGFHKEFENQLSEQLSLKYDYDAHFCVLQDSDIGVKDYLTRMQEKEELAFTCSLTEEYALYMTEKYKDMYSEHSLELAKRREHNITKKSDTDRVKCLKIMKHYAPMWELLLKYFKCTSSMKTNNSVVTETPVLKLVGLSSDSQVNIY